MLKLTKIAIRYERMDRPKIYKSFAFNKGGGWVISGQQAKNTLNRPLVNKTRDIIKVENGMTQGKWLLYLTDPVELEGPGICYLNPKHINSLGLRR